MRIYNGNQDIDYINNLYITHDEILTEIEHYIKSHEQKIHISAIEGKLLQLIIQMNHINNIIEIGTHCGYSTLWMANALGNKGKITTIEKEIKRANIAQQFFNRSNSHHKIELLQGDANLVLAGLNYQFDMIFIDANKASYPIYLDWAEENIRTGGIIIADNCLLSGAVSGNNSTNKFSQKQITNMKLFNQRISNSNKYQSIMLPCFDGMTVAIKLF